MALSISCLYVRSLILSGTRTIKGSNVYEEIYEKYNAQFGTLDNFLTYSRKVLKEKFKLYANFIKVKKLPKETLDHYIENYTTGKWSDLNIEEQLQHSVKTCNVSFVSFMLLHK